MQPDEPQPERMSNDDEAGGDPVCWLHLVCDSCGALIERAGDPHRPGCAVAPAPDP